MNKEKIQNSVNANYVLKEDYPNPYTTSEDPELFFCDYKNKTIKSKYYSDLSYDCKLIIQDLVDSSSLEVFQRWDKNFRRKYYARAVFIAYELGKQNNASIFNKLKEWFFSLVKFKTIS